MDRFFDRLGDVIKNFLDDEDEKVFGRGSSRPTGGDPDLDAAYDELDEFLKGGKSVPPGAGKAGTGQSGTGRTGTGQAGYGGAGRSAGSAGSARTQQSGTKDGGIPEALRADFAELGVPFGANAEDCKAAYKKLLKIHHPDRHAGHEGNMRKATEKASRINASYRRIESWRETGRME